MDEWQLAALDYVRSWIGFQMRLSEQPGCVVAVAHRDRIVLECAFGHADLATGEALTPRHRFRIASHAKSFTAAGILKLRERGALRLDDPVGRYVTGLNRAVAAATISQLLSHSAGLTRDGRDSGQFTDRRPYLSADELRAELKRPPPIDANTRFKYSNHGYALLGLLIEAVTGEAYAAWIRREILDPAGLRETDPDLPIASGTRFARGHTGKLPLGRRLTIPGDNPANAIAAAGGFASTASDVARFFAQLAPDAAHSVLSVASRREMIRRHWRNPDISVEGYYGLGTSSGSLAGWDWFGHSGGLQGYITRTAVVPGCDLTVSILTNSIDGWAPGWVDGVLHILRAFADNGPPPRSLADWAGRWWTIWGANDLVPTGRSIFIANPYLNNPFLDASEITPRGRGNGRITRAGGYGSYGEAARLVRAADGAPGELWLGASKLLPEPVLAKEMQERYAATGGRRMRKRRERR